MKVIRITREFSFEMSHVLEGYDGRCNQIHGHSYRLFVTVRGTPEDDPSSPKFGMVMDFGFLKELVNRLIINNYDHSFVIRSTAGNIEFIDTVTKHYKRVIVTGYQPTCENLVLHFAKLLRDNLPTGVNLHSLKLHETASSFAEWYAEDNR